MSKERYQELKEKKRLVELRAKASSEAPKAKPTPVDPRQTSSLRTIVDRLTQEAQECCELLQTNSRKACHSQTSL